MPKTGMEPIRKAAVINATLECICETGVKSITLDMVAARAGCSKGVVSYYFKTKRNLTLEAMKAFLSFYQKKSQSEITREMSAEEMLRIVVEQGLPPIDGVEEGQGRDINVSDLGGTAAMHISPDKKARLFVQFFSHTAVNPEFQTVIQQVYACDIAGIASIISYGAACKAYIGIDAVKSAYGLLAMIVGLSFFRVNGICLPENEDNRVVCIDYLQDTLKGGHHVKSE